MFSYFCKSKQLLSKAKMDAGVTYGVKVRHRLSTSP